MKRIKLTQLTIVASLLENTSAAQPNGSIHAGVSREYAEPEGEGEAVYTRDTGDVSITRADLVQRARDLWADCLQYLADENALPVKGSDKAPAVAPRSLAPDAPLDA